MALTWVRKYVKELTTAESIIVPNTFESEHLIISATCFNCRSTWHKAGYLSQSIDFSAFKQARVNNSSLILLNTPMVLSFEHYQLGYQLSFEPASWIDNLTLEIYQPSMPLYSLDTNAPYGATTALTQSITVNDNSTPVLVLAANKNRKNFTIENKGSTAIMIGFMEPMTINNTFLTLAPKTVYVPEINYTDPIFGLTQNDNEFTDLIVTEFT